MRPQKINKLMSPRLRKIYIFIISIIVLLGPAVFYLLLETGKNNFIMLDYFGPKKVQTENGKTDTIYHTVGNFSFSDQQQNIITQNFASGKIYATQFLTTRDSACSKMLRGMQDAVYEYKDDTTLVFITYFIDPVTDNKSTIDSLVNFYRVKAFKWKFLSGNTNSIDNMARSSYNVPVVYNAKDSMWQVSQQVFLVDKEKHLRGIYDGTDLFEIKRLKEEIKVLQYEYRTKNKKTNGE